MKSDTPSTRQVTIPVRGMSCGSCVQHIGKALTAQPGVTSIDVSLPSRSVKVTFDPELAQIETIVSAIRMSGYPAEMAEDQ